MPSNLGPYLPYLPTPSPQMLDYLGRHSHSQGDTEEDETLMDRIGKGELRGQTCHHTLAVSQKERK